MNHSSSREANSRSTSQEITRLLLDGSLPCSQKPTELTGWSRVLLEKLTVAELVKTFHAFYGSRRFITVFTKARLINSIKQNSSWEANSRSASQDIPYLLWNQTVHYRVLKSGLINSMRHSSSWEADISQILTIFPYFYGTRRFITVFFTAGLSTLRWMTAINSLLPHILRIAF
jgi:hypothetical protein